jgi:hypothetical protein
VLGQSCCLCARATSTCFCLVFTCHSRAHVIHMTVRLLHWTEPEITRERFTCQPPLSLPEAIHRLSELPTCSLRCIFLNAQTT